MPDLTDEQRLHGRKPRPEKSFIHHTLDDGASTVCGMGAGQVPVTDDVSQVTCPACKAQLANHKEG